MQSIISPEAASDKEKMVVAPAPEGKPVTDVEAFLASLPQFGDEEVQALASALHEDRAQRRSSSEVEL